MKFDTLLLSMTVCMVLAACGGGTAVRFVQAGAPSGEPSSPAAPPLTPPPSPSPAPVQPSPEPAKRVALSCAASPAASEPTPTPDTASGTVTLLAGQLGGEGHLDGVGDAARFQWLQGITIDGAGNLYVTAQNTIRRISPQRVVKTMAGVYDESGTTDGTGDQARLMLFPGAALSGGQLASDPCGTVYYLEGAALRRMTADGRLTTLAGTWQPGTIVDGPLASASFHDLQAGVTADIFGTVYVQDKGWLRRISPSGQVTTIGGTAAEANGSTGGIFRGALATDAAGNVYASTGVQIQRITPEGTMSVFAGSGSSGQRDGPSAQAEFTWINSIAVGKDGTLYVLDGPPMGSASIRRIAPDGMVSTLMRDTSISLRGLAVDAGGNLYTINGSDQTIDRITLSGTRSVWAGRRGSAASADGVGSAASFHGALSAVADAQGNAYVADGALTFEADMLRKVAPDGTVTTVVARQQDARFRELAIDPAGTVVATDAAASVIRAITPAGAVSTYAGIRNIGGLRDGPRLQAWFWWPGDLTGDPQGNLYVADMRNQAIRKITPDGIVSTLAGNPALRGSVDGTVQSASFDLPSHIVRDPSGNLFVSQENDKALRRITPAGEVTTIAAGKGIAWRASDAAGNLYGSDGGLVRRLTPAGVLTTVAGTPHTLGVRLGALPGSLNTITDIRVLPALPGASGTRLLVLSEDSVLVVALPE
jgi:hypothetical protein